MPASFTNIKVAFPTVEEVGEMVTAEMALPNSLKMLLLQSVLEVAGVKLDRSALKAIILEILISLNFFLTCKAPKPDDFPLFAVRADINIVFWP